VKGLSLRDIEQTMFDVRLFTGKMELDRLLPRNSPSLQVSKDGFSTKIHEVLKKHKLCIRVYFLRKHQRSEGMSLVKIGFPRMKKEAGEHRDFLPRLVANLYKLGASIVLEAGYGSGMELAEADYREVVPTVDFVSHEEAYRQDYVVVLRCPEENEIRWMQPGACLISMLHYPTRPERVRLLQSLGLDAVSLDSIRDDNGRRLIENLRAVGWNGMHSAFRILQTTYPDPGFESPQRSPIAVTLLGAGAVASHAMHSAIRYGDVSLQRRMARSGVPGVVLTVLDYDVTDRADIVRRILSHTDILVDATQRVDVSKPVIPNDWIGDLPAHAVILDLSADPYDCSSAPIKTKGIEGIPHGDLDQHVFTPEDPVFESLPPCVRKDHRRHTVSCYSWPGIYPRECMEVYGKQIQPILRTLITKGGIRNIENGGRFFERAIVRAQLSRLAHQQEASASFQEKL
jgi:alanine dehydrogenase